MMGASSYIRQRSSTSGELNRRGGPHRALVRPPTMLDANDLRGLRLAVRSREMLENGTHATIAEIAAAEKIDEFLRRPGSACPYRIRFAREFPIVAVC